MDTLAVLWLYTWMILAECFPRAVAHGCCSLAASAVWADYTRSHAASSLIEGFGMTPYHIFRITSRLVCMSRVLSGSFSVQSLTTILHKLHSLRVFGTLPVQITTDYFLRISSGYDWPCPFEGWMAWTGEWDITIIVRDMWPHTLFSVEGKQSFVSSLVIRSLFPNCPTRS